MPVKKAHENRRGGAVGHPQKPAVTLKPHNVVYRNTYLLCASIGGAFVPMHVYQSLGGAVAHVQRMEDVQSNLDGIKPEQVTFSDTTKEHPLKGITLAVRFYTTKAKYCGGNYEIHQFQSKVSANASN